MAKDRKTFNVEIHRFKQSGKYYDTVTLPIEATNDTDAMQELRAERNELGERRKEKGERRKGLRSETAAAVNELVQVGFEKFGGRGDCEPIVLRGKDKG